MPLLELDALTKAYPGVVANDAVSFAIEKGEIHALLGENGAGKSTLVKMIYGLVKPDTGTMHFEGAPFAPSEPSMARRAGVAMVFQHFSLFEALTVAENIALGMEAPPPPSELSSQIKEISERYGLTLDPDRLIGDLSVGERQRVEIVRCLLQDPKLLIMDEPTSVLTPQEVDILFKTLRQLSEEGTAILYISHKLEEIRTLCQNATILRHGTVVATCDPKKETAKSLAEMMVGKKLKSPKKSKTSHGNILCRVETLALARADAFGTDLKDITFSIHAGEVLGIAGVAGNGQDELMLALSGERRIDAGRITLNSLDLSHLSPSQRRMKGLHAAPEERLGHAAVPDMSLTDNTLITGFERQSLGKRGLIDFSKAKKFAERVIETFDVRTLGPNNAAKSLSGGNLQKFVIGREICQKPKLLIVNQPTWGVDAAAAADIRQAILELAREGAAILVLSQDLDELFEICDKVAVLHEGHLSDARDAGKITMEEIGLLMGGMAA
ncbi:MAG: ABC transporter ATP-binding protein [Pseudomonadota bacterium]